jgi:mannose-6-phosphate isomerase-like protein (cupin superfamily)
VTGFADVALPAVPDVTAPDGSDVRILVAGSLGTMAHFELPAGAVSVAVRHRTVEELWFVVAGRGEMWRGDEGDGVVVDLRPGLSLTIPVGTAFQFRSTGDEPLAAVAVTMPPWPGDDEAVRTIGPWEPTVG